MKVIRELPESGNMEPLTVMSMIGLYCPLLVIISKQIELSEDMRFISLHKCFANKTLCVVDL